MGVIFEFQLDLLEKLFLLLSLRLPLEETIIKPCKFDSLSLDFGELGERLELFFDLLLLLNHFIIKTNYHKLSYGKHDLFFCCHVQKRDENIKWLLTPEVLFHFLEG